MKPALRTLFVLALGLAAAALPGQGASQGASQGGRTQWSAELVDQLGSLPVMGGGRVKPMLSHAGVSMLMLSNKRSLTLEEGARIQPVDWWLTVALEGDEADQLPIFKVTDVAVIEQIGLSTAGHKKRDSFSYAELEPGLSRLFAEARKLRGTEPDDRSRLQKQTWDLYLRVSHYESIRMAFAWARADFELGDEVLRDRFGGASSVRFSDLLPVAHELVEEYKALGAAGATVETDPHMKALDGVIEFFEFHTGRFDVPFEVIPPDMDHPGPNATPEQKHAWEFWRDPLHLAAVAVRGEPVTERELDVLRALEDFARAEDDGARAAAIARVDELSRAIAEDRGADETRAIGLEVSYLDLNLHWHGIWFFVLAFLFGAASVLVGIAGGSAKGGQILRWFGNGALGVGLAMLVGAVTLRCMIQLRPPITNLYETILFIAAIVVASAAVLEWFHRKGFSLAIGGALGAIAVLGAHRFEFSSGDDTMRPLVAVLDDNFWLATHVTTINIGYAAGMLAAAVAAVTLVIYAGVRLASPRIDPPWFRGLYRSAVTIVYAVTCFGVFFGVVGTILGGVWANDSWGRFWGWDPKENGALMIVLAQLFILHGRLGGHLLKFGQLFWATLTGTIVIFSWFHVNQLGVGLHAYGFSEAVDTAIGIGYWTFGTMAGVGLLGRIIEWTVMAAGEPTGETQSSPPPLPSQTRS